MTRWRWWGAALLVVAIGCDDGGGSLPDQDMDASADASIDAGPPIDVCNAPEDVCDGDPTGTWQMVEACDLQFEVGAANINVNGCEAIAGQVELTSENDRPVVYDVDGTSEGTAQAGFRFTGTFPSACYETCPRNCDVIEGVGCRCSFLQPTGGVGGRNWSTEDGVLHLTGLFGDYAVDYCVANGELSLAFDLFGSPVRLRFVRAVGGDGDFGVTPHMLHLLEGHGPVQVMTDGKLNGQMEGYGISTPLTTVSVGEVAVELQAEGEVLTQAIVPSGRRGRQVHWVAWNTANPTVNHLPRRGILNATADLPMTLYDSRAVEPPLPIPPGTSVELSDSEVTGHTHLGVDTDRDGAEDRFYGLSSHGAFVVSTQEGVRVRHLDFEGGAGWLTPLETGGSIEVVNLKDEPIVIREVDQNVRIPAKSVGSLGLHLGVRAVEIETAAGWEPLASPFIASEARGYIIVHDQGDPLVAVAPINDVQKLFHLVPELGPVDALTFWRDERGFGPLERMTPQTEPLTSSWPRNQQNYIVLRTGEQRQPQTAFGPVSWTAPGVFLLPTPDGTVQLWTRSGNTIEPLESHAFARPLVRFVVPAVEGEAIADVEVGGALLARVPLDAVSDIIAPDYLLDEPVTIRAGATELASLPDLPLYPDMSAVHIVTAAGRAKIEPIPAQAEPGTVAVKAVMGSGPARARFALATRDCSDAVGIASDWTTLDGAALPGVLCVSLDGDRQYELQFPLDLAPWVDQAVLMVVQTDGETTRSMLIPYEEPAVQLTPSEGSADLSVLHFDPELGPVSVEVNGVPTAMVEPYDRVTIPLTVGGRLEVRVLHEGAVVWSQVWAQILAQPYEVLLFDERPDERNVTRVVNLSEVHPLLRVWESSEHPDATLDAGAGQDLHPYGVVPTGGWIEADFDGRESGFIVLDAPGTPTFDLQVPMLRPGDQLVVMDGEQGLEGLVVHGRFRRLAEPVDSSWVRVIALDNPPEVELLDVHGRWVERDYASRRAYGYLRTAPDQIGLRHPTGRRQLQPARAGGVYTWLVDRTPEGEVVEHLVEGLDLMTVETTQWALFNATPAELILTDANQAQAVEAGSASAFSDALPFWEVDLDTDGAADVRVIPPEGEGFILAVINEANTPTGVGAFALVGLTDVQHLELQLIER